VIQIQKFALNLAAGGSELLNHHTSVPSPKFASTLRQPLKRTSETKGH